MGRSCSKCGTSLTEDNWYKSDKEGNPKHYRCKTCVREDKRKYELANKDKLNISRQAFRRKYRLGQAGGVVLKVVKRDYTNKCEICGKDNCKLDYHHWDNSNYMKGLWLCRVCHYVAESVDAIDEINSRSQKYIELKKKLEEGLL